MTHRLTPEELRELLGAYAVDAIAPWEAQQVEELLERDPAALTEVEAHRETLAVLATAVAGDAEPPPRLWDAITGGLSDAPPPLLLVAAGTEATRRRFTPWLAGLAAAAALVLVALAGVRALDRPEPTIERAAQSAVTAPGAEVVVLEGDAGVQVRVALQPDGVGYVLEGGLPVLPADRTYQLWAIVGEEVISAGVLGADPAVTPFQVSGTLAGLAITEEVAGGVAVSENAPYAVWLRDA